MQTVAKLQIHALDRQEKSNQIQTEGIIACMLLLSGLAKLLIPAFSGITVSWTVYALMGIGLSLIGGIVLCSRFREYLFLVMTGVLAVAGIFSWSYLRNGMLLLANEVLHFLTEKTGTIYLDYGASAGTGEAYAAAWVYLFFCIFIVMALTGKGYALTVPGILLAVGCGSGFFESSWGICLVAAGLVLLCLRKTEGIRRIPVTAGLLLLCVLAAGGLTVLRKKSSPEDTWYKIRRAVHEWRYDDPANAMPEGDLRDLGPFVKSGETALEITMEQPEKLYLRGRTAEIYTGVSWDMQDGEALEEAADDFYWLHKAGFYGQEEIAKASALTGETDAKEMTIRNLTACRKWQYLPYALADTDSLDARKAGDAGAETDGTETVVTYLPGSVPEWYQVQRTLADTQTQTQISDYLEQEQVYRDYVYKYDLQLTNAALGVCNRLLGSQQTERTLPEIRDLIRATLEEQIDYSETVQTWNGKTDFFQYVIEQSKAGYSVQYATAATLMLRYCGVPARYVEGYFLSREEAANYRAGDTIQLSEAHAHAWTEYYLDGIGWIPFEVTPGYIDDEETAAAMGDGSGSGSSFASSQLTYVAPENPKEEQTLRGKFDDFHLTAGLVIRVISILMLILLAVLLRFIYTRYRKFRGMQEKIAVSEHKDAVAILYAYACMLKKKAALEEQPTEPEIRALNEEALFSTHEMTEEQQNRMETYQKQVLENCRERWKPWQKFWYRYIWWLYE